MTSRNDTDRMTPDEKRALLKQLLERGNTKAPANTLRHTGPVRRPASEPASPSSAQERMWFLHQLQPESAAYNVARAVELRGELNPPALEEALRQLLARHPALRSLFPSSEGRPQLAFQEVPSRVLALEDLSSTAEAGREVLLSRRLNEEAVRPFLLEQGPLYRFRLLRLAPQRHVLLLVLHHLVLDGWSLNVLMRELGTLASGLMRGQTPQLPPLPLEYADFAAWQRGPEASALEAEQLEYWKRQLADAPPLLELPADKARPAVRTDRGAQTEPLPLPPALAEAVRTLCRERQVTPFMVFYAAFATLLHRYSQQTDLCVGTPVASRTHLSLEGVVGLFVNTVVLRHPVHPDTTFSALLAQVRQTVLAAYNHQGAPFERVVEALQVERHLGRTPLFQVMFDLYQEERSLTDALAELGARPVHVDTGTSQFDLSLTVVEGATGFALSFQYSSELFEPDTVRRMLGHYLQLLTHAVAAPHATVAALPMLSAIEREQVLNRFNDTARPFDAEATIASLFEAQVARTPEAPAVVAPEGTLTFRQLSEQASRLAAHLAHAGAGPETVVGLCLERSLDAVVSLLAIFLSGAGCLPLEASHPAARRAALLRQSGARLVVSRPGLFAGETLPVPLVSPDVRTQAALPEMQPRRARAEHLAYLLYTSGSTGEPKGVELTHRNVVHCFASFDEYYETQPGDCWASSGSLSFDIHLEELLFSITRGARTVLREVGPLGLGRDILRHGVTHIVMTPSSLAVAAEEPGALAALRSLKVLVSGGEVLPEQLVQLLAFTRTKLVNTYGPTETSINVAAERTPPQGPVRLGRPLDRSRLYVLDGRGEPVPPGVPGELYVGGMGLGRGYRGKPHLTAERFLPDAFSGVPGARLYRTGDRVRWNADGSLSFLGRTDFQVKVRGVRVELEEIEAALLRQPGVRQAAVVVRGSGRETRLEAFLVQEGEATSAARQLREALSRTLPEAMVPSRFIVLPALPFTTSGKVDRKALAALQVEAVLEETAGEPPRGPVEQLLAQLFCQLLGRESVQRGEDFFLLGGHSLSATRLVARVRQAFSVELPLTALFAAPTVAGLARTLEALQGNLSQLPAPAPRPAEAPLALSFAQERMWFLQQLQPGSSAYHLTETLELNGPLQEAALEEALRSLLVHHPVLRTCVATREGQPLPRLQPVPPHVLQRESLAGQPEATLQARLREESDRPFDMERGPLYRFCLWQLAPERHVLLLAFHHLLVDGLSLVILLRELGQAYAALRQGQQPPLPGARLDYADVVAWQRTPALQEHEARQLAYWKQQLDGAPRLLQLPTDKARPVVLSDTGGSTSRLPLPAALAKALGEVCRQHQVTPFMALHAVFAALLYRYSGQEDFCVGVPVAGRPHPSLEDMVGLFTNTVVLRTRLEPGTSFASLLTQVRTHSLEAFAHQDVAFDKLVSHLGVERSTSHAPLFQVAFAWHRFDYSLTETLPGLTTRPLPLPLTAAKFELALGVYEDASQLGLELEYNAELFEPTTAQRLLGHYLHLLEHALRAPHTRLDSLRLLSEDERHFVLRACNETHLPLPEQDTVVSLLSAHARRTPDKLALVSDDARWTYAALDAHVSRAARGLVEQGVTPESLVALVGPRTEATVRAVLSLHRAGAAFLPLESRLPPARIAQVLAESRAPFALALEGADALLAEALALLPEGARPRVLTLEGLQRFSPEPLPRRDSPEGLAYVLFTSGSTGVPKGVMIHQRGMLNHILGMQRALGLGDGDVLAQTAALSFDISVWQMLAAFVLGGTTRMMADSVVREPLKLAAALHAAAVTTVQLVPSVLQALLEEGEGSALPAFTHLRRMATIGEALPPSVCRAWFARYPHLPLFNTYGPAEASDTATVHPLRSAPERATTPIGLPKANMAVYVLDEALQPVPVGIVGELYIGGTGVGRGYLNRPELTAERFLPDPFASRPGARLYRTGDLGRRLADGSLEFLSRADFQVKVRGMRIELQEVESALRQLPEVRSAAVLAVQRRPGDTALVAYVVATDEGTREASLLQALSRVLPGYMVPARCVLLRALPYNANGKLDRKALAALPLEEVETQAAGEPPRGPVEQLLAQLFCQVLGREAVRREEDFFQLGGHSLSATRLAARVRQAFGVELPLTAVFSKPTVAALARELEALRGRGGTELPAPVARPAGEPPVLSAAQERLWFLQQLLPDSSAYHTPEAVELTGPLNVAALEAALRWLLARHSALRLAVPSHEGSPMAVLRPVPALVLRQESLAGLPEAQLEHRLREAVDSPFSLEQGPLYRFHLWQLAPERHVLLLVFHHLLVDGLSLDRLLRELAEAYAAFRQGPPPSLPPVALEYSDVAAWQRTDAVRAREKEQLAYWKQQLAGAPGLLQLPTDKPRPAVGSHRGDFTGLHPLPPALARALQDFCRQHQVTPFMVLYAAFATLLSRYSGQDELCVGTPASGRTHPATEDVVGLLVTTVVLRTRLAPSASFSGLLSQVRTTTLEALAHQDAPFESLVQELGIERSPSHAPLFQVMFDLIRGEHTLADAFPGLQARNVLMASHGSAFDLALSIFERGEGYELGLRYSTELFEADTARRMLGHYLRLLTRALEAPSTRLDALPLLTDAERHRLLVAWNDTRADFPRDVCLHSLIEAQAARTPDAVALVSEQGQLTYRELDQRTHQLARHLRRLGVGPEVRVGVCAERSLEMVVGLLGVLKAGGAYVPLDPSLPRERLAFMLEDSAVPVLLLQEKLRALLPESAPRCVSLDGDWGEVAQESVTPVESGVTAEHLAYAIYTSGSTGRPKLALNGHRAIVNRLVWMQDAYRLTPQDVVLQKTPYSFDVSVWEFFWPLLTGARLVMARPEGHKDPAYLRRTIQEHGVTTLHFVPSMLQAFAEEPGIEACTSLKRIICSGEALPHALQEQVLSRLPVELHNLYGPTEAAVDVSFWACARDSHAHVVPIGRPISNTRLHILDGWMQPVPLGVHGELYIGGVAVGRGYHARPDLTAERFIPDPFSPEPGARLYKTGDRARYLPDGSIDFLGRMDFQVKIRGNRIELGEIETVLGRHPAVAEAAVGVREDGRGDKRLVGYVVPREAPVAAETLRAWLQQSLPEYMVPATFLSLERMPVSPNGKLDRKALGALKVEDAAQAPGEPPRGPVEELLAGLFRTVLGVEQVRRDDSFFHLGGHSLSATRLVARVRQAFNVELPLTAVFSTPTVAGLARAMASLQGTAREALPAPMPRPAEAPLALSFAQERMWFLQQLQPDSSAYHIVDVVELTGALEADALEESLRLLLARHPVLRTTVSSHEGRPVPRVQPLPARVLSREPLAGRPEATLQARLREESDRPFDMERGPLYRFCLWQLAPERHVLLLVFHHLLVDALSLAVLLRELGQAYTALRQGQQPTLPPVRLDYADVVAWQRTPALQALEHSQLDFWRKQLAEVPQVLQLPTDRPRPGIISDKGGSLAPVRLPEELTQALEALCRQHQVTPFMVLQAAFAALLHRYSGQEDFCVGVPVAGRTHPATEDVVGLFANTVVLRTRLAPSDSFAALLAQVRTASLEAFAHQDVAFDKLVSHLGVKRSPSHGPLFQVALAWNRPGSALAEALPGLSVRSLPLPVSTSKVDLALIVREEGATLELGAEYSADLFDASTLQGLLGALLQLLTHALRAPGTRLDALHLLSPEEHARVVRQFNDTTRPFDSQATVVSLFEAQAARTPDATALVARDGSLTYRLLEAQATALAGHLAAQGARAGTVVGVCLERTTELLVAMLAVLKTGAAYLPLEPTHPASRRAVLLRSAGAQLVVAHAESFPEPLTDVLRVEPGARGSVQPRPPSAEDVAIVLFTSGTTGVPKAIEVPHRNLGHLFETCDTHYPVRAGDAVLALTSVAYDIHALDVLYPLCRGARLVLRETGPLELARDVRKHQATHLLTTPSVLRTALEEPEAAEAFQQLSFLHLGGEALDEALVRRLAGGRVRLLNGYGPSETTCTVTLHPQQPGAPVRLGRPLERVRFYVLDSRGEPVPPGVPGELFIGGECVTRGYRGRPELTAERFVPDAFSGVPGARLYRTGDRVRWNADGTLSFIGRGDLQVKVRGMRIELEEIEAALLRQPGVRQAAVVPRQHGGETRLDAFIRYEGDTARAEETLRAALASVLPGAMVPSRIIPLDALPRVSDFKVDRKALALLAVDAPPAPPRALEPPQGPTEELVAELFQRLLGSEAVGRTSHFFELGGHSLSAVQLVTQLRRAFGVELPLSAVFSDATVAGLAARVGSAPREQARLVPVQPRPTRAPASLMQERLWYALQLPEAPPYTVVIGLVLEGALDAAKLEAALAAVVERNETLRTTFHAEGESVFTQAHALTGPVLARTDLSHLPPEEALAAARAAVTRHDHLYFDLSRGPLYRFELLRLEAAGQRHVLIATGSHLVIDGLGMQALLEELATAYRAARAGEPSLLPPAEVQYADFALWQRRPEHLRALDESLESWKQALAHAPEVLDLPLDFPRRAPALNANMRPVRLSLRAGDVSALKALARQEGVSTFTAVLALMQAWLHRLSAQSHVVVASPFSGRTLARTERMVGYFTQVLPLCTDVSQAPSLRTLLKRAHAVVAHATTHQEVAFKRIADAVQPEAGRTAPPLAQALLLMDPLSTPALDGLSVSNLDAEGVIPAYDVVLNLSEQANGAMVGQLATDSALFTATTASRMAGAFEQLVTEALRAPDVSLSRLSLLSAEQRAQVLAALDGGPQPLPVGACVHTLFELQVQRSPEAPAVADSTTTWSYAELNARANQLAARLLSQGLRPEERVGVVMAPSAQALAVLLGILKAGGAYVPLDPGWPEARKRTVLERAGVRRLWVDEAAMADHYELAPLVEVPPQPTQVAGELGPGPRAVADTQLAYIVFTSGSTGEPKGVMVEHRSVVNHNAAIAGRFGLRPGDRMLQFAPLSFDAAAEDLYPPLAVGATVVMRSGLVPAHAMTPYLEQEGITVISLPPTYIEEWVREMEAQGQRVPARLHLLAPGGDVLKRETYEAWVRVGGAHAPWVNVYGPTECTITSATCDIPGAEGLGTDATFPIGRPMPRVRFYLLDEHFEPVLPGLPGRVYIGGAALSRGYLGAPHQTAERFIPDPFSREPGARMYHTGDLARLQPDGRLRFLGRADHQVKIRGFRIELSEIEACLRRAPEVEEAVVLARTAATGLQQLCAYVQAPPHVRVDALRTHVSAQLPAYMVPAAFVVMEKLPVNNNGKIDRQALPDPDALQAQASTPEPTAEAASKLETPFRSTLEMRLQRLWSDVLRQPTVTPEDDFFALGGDSILAMRLLGRMEEEFGQPVPLATLFQYPILKQTVDAVREVLEAGPNPSCVVPLFGPETPQDAPAFFVFHPGDGELHHYRFIAPGLEPHFRCFGLQAPETLSSRTFASFDERIAAYVADIQAVQPHGPYRLFGYSYGGYLAYGVAAALEAAGEQVELLAMLDTLTFDTIDTLAAGTVEPALLLAKEFEVYDAALEQELAPLSAAAKWDVLAARARAKGTAASHFEGRDFAHLWHVLGEVLVPQVRGWRVPPPPRAKLLLFRAEATATRDETLGWSQYVPRERMEVLSLTGSHFSALQPPGVNSLLQRLLAARGGIAR